MASDGTEFLAKAVELETAGEGAFEKRLEACLNYWQSSLPECSFATAFCIVDGRKVDRVFNGLPPPNPQTVEWQCFVNLLTNPIEVEGRQGSWPWQLLRQEETSNSGVFGHVIRDLRAVELPNFDSTNHLTNQLNTAFNEYEGAPAVEVSWKWYGDFPTKLGDTIREGKKKTNHVVYLLGTRREFSRIPRGKDYGLIVGLTDKVTNQDAAAKQILASWNLLVVAPHILEDADSIGQLRAAGAFSHTFRTHAEAHVGPAVSRILSDAGVDDTKKRQVDALLKEVRDLAAFMEFVSRGGVPGGWVRKRDVEPTAYDVVDFVKSALEEMGQSEFVSPTVAFEWATPVSQRLERFVSRVYLRAILAELVSNMRGHGVATDETVAVSISCEVSENSIDFVFKNQRNGDGGDDAGHPISGSETIANMVMACGGTLSSNATRSAFTTRLKFDLNSWKSALEKLDQADGEGIAAPRDRAATLAEAVNSARSQIPRRAPPPNEWALRCLVLDDELHADAVHTMLSHLHGKWQWYKREIRSEEFWCAFVDDWKLEVVLCDSVYKFRDALVDEKFDLCLADVDFRKDTRAKRGVKGQVPTLGGILPALCLAWREDTYVRVFTAKNVTVRDDANIDFIAGLADKGKFGAFRINDCLKNLAVELPIAFTEWVKAVLPKRIPKSIDAQERAAALAMALAKETIHQESGVPAGLRSLQLRKLGEAGAMVEVSPALFRKRQAEAHPGLLDIADDASASSIEIARRIATQLTGHGLVRQFWIAFHDNLLGPINEGHLKHNEYCNWLNLLEHRFELERDALKNSLGALAADSNNESAKRLFRTKLCDLGTAGNGANGKYIYGLSFALGCVEGENAKEKFSKALKGLLIDNGTTSELIVEFAELTAGGGCFKISGNRKEIHSNTSAAGGSLGEVKKTLEKLFLAGWQKFANDCREIWSNDEHVDPPNIDPVDTLTLLFVSPKEER